MSFREAKSSKTPLSLGYHGNIVDLWWVGGWILKITSIVNTRPVSVIPIQILFIFYVFMARAPNMSVASVKWVDRMSVRNQTYMIWECENIHRPSVSFSPNFQLRERLLLEYERTGELLVDLGSDQTSLHNPFNGGYYPVQLSFRQANQLMSTDPNRFRTMVQERWYDSDSQSLQWYVSNNG